MVTHLDYFVLPFEVILNSYLTTVYYERVGRSLQCTVNGCVIFSDQMFRVEKVIKTKK
jgi:hypothetical protein